MRTKESSTRTVHVLSKDIELAPAERAEHYRKIVAATLPDGIVTLRN